MLRAQGSVETNCLPSEFAKSSPAIEIMALFGSWGQLALQWLLEDLRAAFAQGDQSKVQAMIRSGAHGFCAPHGPLRAVMAKHQLTPRIAAHMATGGITAIYLQQFTGSGAAGPTAAILQQSSKMDEAWATVGAFLKHDINVSLQHQRCCTVVHL